MKVIYISNYKHNIKKSIKISKSYLKDILSKDDKDFITNNE